MNHKAFKATTMGDAGTGSAVIATLGVIDKDSDVLLPGVFGKQPTRIVPAHDWQSVMLGRATVSENGNQGIADFAFNLDIPVAKDWHSALKFDLANDPPLQEWSWGFDILPGAARSGELDGAEVRFIGPLPDGSPGVRVFEISPVLLGAGVGTRTVAVKAALTFSQEIEQAREMLDRLHKRAKGVLEWRQACGRPSELPKQRRAELAEIEELLGELSSSGAHIKTLLAAKEVASATVDSSGLLAEFERTKFDISRISS